MPPELQNKNLTPQPCCSVSHSCGDWRNWICAPVVMKAGCARCLFAQSARTISGIFGGMESERWFRIVVISAGVVTVVLLALLVFTK